MKIFDSLKENIKKGTKKAGDLVPHSDLSVSLDCKEKLEKTSKKLEWMLTLSSKETIKVKKISYEIREDVDPIIGKNKDEADMLWTKETKKWFTLNETDSKEISFEVPIIFANEQEKKWWWDLRLLNQMSERSRKTAINYDLIITISYENPEDKSLLTKKIKHGINFE